MQQKLSSGICKRTSNSLTKSGSQYSNVQSTSKQIDIASERVGLPSLHMF